MSLPPGFEIRLYRMPGLTRQRVQNRLQHLMGKQNLSRSSNSNSFSPKCGVELEKELTPTRRVCSPWVRLWVAILGTQGEGELGGHGWYGSWSHAAWGWWRVKREGGIGQDRPGQVTFSESFNGWGNFLLCQMFTIVREDTFGFPCTLIHRDFRP